MGEIIAFENEYAKVACKFGIITTLISPARLVKCQATNIKISKDKEITFTKACKMAINYNIYMQNWIQNFDVNKPDGLHVITYNI